MPALPDAFKVMEAWDFKYKTCAFSWVKIKKDGMPLHVIRDRIVQLFGNLSMVELFARQKIEGWESIGFGIDGISIHLSPTCSTSSSRRAASPERRCLPRFRGGRDR